MKPAFAALLVLLVLLAAAPASARIVATVNLEAAGIAQTFNGELRGDPKDITKNVLSIVKKFVVSKREAQFELTLRPDERKAGALVYSIILNINGPEKQSEVFVMKARAVIPFGETVTLFSDPDRSVKLRLDASGAAGGGGPREAASGPAASGAPIGQ